MEGTTSTAGTPAGPARPATHEEADEHQRTMTLIDGRFAHTVAHELRSPLTAIQMCADSIRRSDDAGARDRYASLIGEQARVIAWTLESLVAMANNPPRDSADPGSVDLGQVAQESVDDLAQIADARQLSLSSDLHAGTPSVQGGSDALRQAVRSCLHALVSSVPQGSSLSVGTSGPHTDQLGRQVCWVSVTARSPAGRETQRLHNLDLPWHRLSLLTASRLVEAHQGSVSESREPDVLGLRIAVPVAVARAA